jgi:FHA domain
VPVAVLTVLKFCLVALIFLFLARVLRAVWVEINAPAPDPDPVRSAHAVGPAVSQRTGTEPTRSGRGDRRSRRSQPSSLALVVLEPVADRGTRYDLDSEMTIGRAPGSTVVVTDSFASQLHARVFERDGAWFVEDLGSRNGTWRNRDQVHGPMRLERGDRVKVGDTVFEVSE